MTYANDRLGASILQGASRLGIDPYEYRQHVERGLKWCSGHKCWEATTAFGRHRRRADGLNTVCIVFDRIRAQTAQRKKRARGHLP